jgi:hypothetical protein
MNRTPLKLAIGIAAMALIALLAYSLERTAWLFGLYEQHDQIALAAALVVELAAVALIVGAAPLALLAPEARAWSNRALLAVLSTQALANLSAGFLRGGQQTLELFGQPDDIAAYMVAATLWLVTNLAIPALVLCLSKLLEHLLAALASQPSASQPDRPLVEETHESRSSLRPALAQAAEPIAEYATARLQMEGVSDQRTQSPAIGVMGETLTANPRADRVCRACGASNLTAIEVARHGRQRKRSGMCLVKG